MTSLNYQDIKDWMTQIKNCLLDRATGGEYDEKNYKALREKLIRLYHTTDDKSFKQLFPADVRNYQTLNAFWNMIKIKFQHYSERRKYLTDIFLPIEQYIDGKIYTEPSKCAIVVPVNVLSLEYIEQTASKANSRIQSKDYDGAITTAKTLVAEVEDNLYEKIYGKKPTGRIEDNVLHKAVMDGLNMSIQPDLSKRLKKIISGLNSIYGGISELRNVAGDPHKKKYIPNAHHAQLAVNSAFTLCEFLCSSYMYQCEHKTTPETF